MASTLMRLFRFAKAGKNEAKENFTTEALAAAIRAAPDPFLLAFAPVLRMSAPLLAVDTQVPVAGFGIVDLVVQFGDPRAPSSLWVEVKVDAGESGDQLSRYAEYIRSLPEEGRPRLAVLGPARLRDDLPWVSWQGVRRAVTETKTQIPCWLDLKVYLEEIHMADDYSDPVNTSEASALGPAHALLGKAARILAQFSVRALTSWPSSHWPTDEAAVRKRLGSSFRQWGTLSVDAQVHFRVGVGAGVYHDKDTGEAGLGVWVYTRPNWVADRERVSRQANTGGLGQHWVPCPGEWEFLGTYKPLREFGAPDAAATWLHDRLLDLERAGVLALLPKLGVVSPEEEAEVEGEP